MRYADPIFRKMSRADKLRYEPEIRTIIGQLWARTRKLWTVGQKLGKKRGTAASVIRNLGDGKKVKVTIMPLGTGIYPLVIVEVYTPKGRTIVEAAPLDSWMLYLESGFTTLSLTPSVTEGVTYYTDALLANYSAKASTPAWLDKLEIPDGSVEVVYTNLSDIVANDFTVEDYTTSKPSSTAWPAGHTKGQFLIGDGDQGLNYGTQTGKALKLWQCLAGAETGYNSVASAIHGPATIDESIILFTSSSLDYYLLKITRTEIYAAELQFSELGTRLLDLVKATSTSRIDRTDAGDQLRRDAEAYVLSEANALGAWTLIHTFSNPLPAEQEPLAYGWAANWDGTELSIVTQERMVVGNRTQYITARRHKLDIELSESAWSVTESWDQEDVDWAPGFDIWVPVVENGITKTMVWYPYGCNDDAFLRGYGADPGDYNAPVYCFYDTTNELVQIRAYKESQPTKTWTQLIHERDAYFSALGTTLWICGGDSEIDVDWEGQLNGQKSGFYCSNAVIGGEPAESSTKNAMTVTVTSGGYKQHIRNYAVLCKTVTVTSGYTCGAYGDGVVCVNETFNVGDTITRYLYHAHNEWFYGTFGTMNGEKVLCIPLHSSEAVYLTRYQRRLGKDMGYSHGWAGRDLWDHDNTNGADKKTKWNWTVFGTWGCPTDWAGCYNGSVPKVADTTDERRLLHTLVTSGGEVNLGDEIDFTTYGYSAKWITYFNPYVCGVYKYPYFDEGGPISAQVSVGTGGTVGQDKPQVVCRGYFDNDATHPDPTGSDELGDVTPLMLRNGLWTGRA